MKDLFISPKDMGKVDRDAIEVVGIPSIVLMENAKNAIVQWILENVDGKLFYIFAGPGNNGGDALAVGRELLIQENQVKIYLLGNPNKGSKDYRTNLDILKKLNAEIVKIDHSFDFNDLEMDLKIEATIIDGIFGTGLERTVEGDFAKVIEIINRSENFVLSIDIPSGLNGDTGEEMGICVHSSMTLTLQLPKKCFKNFKGNYKVVKIGIPDISIKRALENKE